MNPETPFDLRTFNPEDPDPWMALYVDDALPIADEAKHDWLTSCRSWPRQFVMPFARPFGRLCLIAGQLVKTVIPNRCTSSWLLHRILYWGLRTFVRPDANRLILRHFHIGSEVLDFINRNVPGVQVPLHPLRPRTLADLKDNVFVQHDLNLFNFIIRLNQQLKEKKLVLKAVDAPDFGGITDTPFPLDPLPDRWTNFIDLETAIELFTPVYQLFLTDNDFWRACNSLQLDETVGLYVARLLNTSEHLLMVNNKHPLVPDITLSAGYRLVLHGLSSEMLHALLRTKKRLQEGNATPV